MVAPRKAAFAEESAEVEVLFANMDKLKGLTKKIQGSLNRLETSGKSVQDAIGPIYGNTQKLQVANKNVDRILEAIERVREPLDQRNREERIIRAGPRKAGLADFIASLDRTTQALAGLKNSNMRSNQQAIGELSTLLQTGTRQLEEVFRELLREDTRPVEPLHFITKDLPFPALPQDKSSRLRLINTHLSASVAQMASNENRETPTIRAYADVRGDYITTSLRNLAAASVSTARKTSADAIYKQGASGIGTYARGIEGLYLAEYENICPIFARDEWADAYLMTCRSSLKEFANTLNELNGHIKANLFTDCFLGYEIIDIITNLSLRLETRTGGELKRQIAETVKPVRETAKGSLPKLLEDTRSKVQSLISLPTDGGTLPVTIETMTRLQNMVAYLPAVTSLLTSIGDGQWNTPSATSSSTSIPTLKSFDVGPDGRALFSHYATDMIDSLMSNLESKSRMLLKGKSLQGVFISNNVAVIDRMIRSSDLQPLMASATGKVDNWRKKGSSMYLDGWKEPSAYLLDVQYTNRGSRPHSGGGGPIDSAAVVKGLGSKDKDAIKEKFRNFNMSFDDLIARHKSYRLEKEVKPQLARDIQNMIEPLYGRFWDRYHDIDKGKGKYAKYDKGQLASQLASLG